MSDRFRDALTGAIRRAERREWVYGLLGRKNSGGSFTFHVPGRRGFLYVTVRNASGAQTVVPARNDFGVPLQKNLGVRMKLEYGVYVILGRANRNDLVNTPADDDYGITPHPIGSHMDASFTEPYTDGYAITWDAGSNSFVLSPAAAGALDDLSDVVITTPTPPEVLYWNGTNWVNGLVDWNDLDNLPLTFPPDLHASEHLEGGGDSLTATTPVADGVPQAYGNNKLDQGWFNLDELWTFISRVVVSATATSGAALRVVRNLASGSTDAPVVEIHQDHASDDQAALDVTQDGTGDVAIFKDGATTVLRIRDGGRLEIAQIIRALTGSGVVIQDDGGNVVATFHDSGGVTVAGSLVASVTGGAHTLERVLSSGNDLNGATILKSRKTINMGDGFGTGFLYAIEDDAAVSNVVAITGAVRDGADNTGAMRAFVYNAGVAFQVYEFKADGRVGMGGITSPQGYLHLPGYMVVEKTGVAGSTVVLIPNAAGDVTVSVHVTFTIASSAGGGTSNTFTLTQGGTMSSAIGVGGSTWTVTLNANGQLSVARTAGSDTATIRFILLWN